MVKVENFPTQTLHVENLGVFCTSPKLAHVQGAPVRLPLTLLPNLLHFHAPQAPNEDPEHLFPVALTCDTFVSRAQTRRACFATLQQPIFGQRQISRLLGV